MNKDRVREYLERALYFSTADRSDIIRELDLGDDLPDRTLVHCRKAAMEADIIIALKYLGDADALIDEMAKYYGEA